MKTIAKLGSVAVVLLLVFMIVFIIPQKIREDFVSSSQLMMQAQTKQGFMSAASLSAFDATLKRTNDIGSLDDSGTLLLLKRCYQITEQLRLPLPQNYMVFIHDMFSSMQQIEDRIIQEISTFRTSISSPVVGNIYVTITQVPYFKNERGNPIYSSYYIDNVLGFQASSSRSNIYYGINIIFANYDTNRTYTKTSSFETTVFPSMEKLATNDKQCFIRCIHSENA